MRVRMILLLAAVLLAITTLPCLGYVVCGSAWLSSPIPGDASSLTFSFITPETGTPQGVRVDVMSAPDVPIKPKGLSFANVPASIKLVAPDPAGIVWNIDKCTDGDRGTLYLQNPSGLGIAAGSYWGLTIPGLTVPVITSKGSPEPGAIATDETMLDGDLYLLISVFDTSNVVAMQANDPSHLVYKADFQVKVMRKADLGQYRVTGLAEFNTFFVRKEGTIEALKVVTWNNATYQPVVGDLVKISGMRSKNGGVKEIFNATVERISSGLLSDKPVAMTNKSVAALNDDGASPFGQLVTIWGRVYPCITIYDGYKSFILDDGSGVLGWDGKRNGILVLTKDESKFAAITSSTFYVVTGRVSYMKGDYLQFPYYKNMPRVLLD